MGSKLWSLFSRWVPLFQLLAPCADPIVSFSQQIRPEEAGIAEGDEDEQDGDVSMANGDAKASTSKAVHSHSKKPLAELEPDSDDDDNDDDEDSDDDAEVDENFRNELLAALQADGVADEFDAAEENDESEEELLDDEQMMALDDKLADIFRLQGGGKKGKKGAFRIPIAAEDLLTQFLFPSRANRRPSLPPPRRRPH